MKKIIGLALVFSLSGCANLQQAPIKTVIAACGAYNAALNTAVQLRSAGKLTQDQINKISVIDKQIYPICSAKTPDSAQTQVVLSAITQVQGAIK